jgi:hypothetical protein
MMVGQDNLVHRVFAHAGRNMLQPFENSGIIANVNQGVDILQGIPIAANEVRVAGIDHAFGIREIGDLHGQGWTVARC